MSAPDLVPRASRRVPPAAIAADFAARAIEVVRTVAAREIVPRFRGVAAHQKLDGSVVTEADFAAQLALVHGLHALEPVPVVAEEMTLAEQQEAFDARERFWCIDPLDGTSNFSRGVPFFAVSVALMEGARPIFGTVYDPIADECFFAVRGAGAWLDQRPLVVPPHGPPLARATAEVSLRREIARALRKPLKERRPYARRVCSGSAALAWCHLAAARSDVILHSGQKMWDYAAGALVLEEAGGFVSGLEQDDYWAEPLWSRSVIAARTRPLLLEWREWIRRELSAQKPLEHG